GLPSLTPTVISTAASKSSLSRGDLLQQSESDFALSSGSSDFDSEASYEQGSPTAIRTSHSTRKAYKRAQSKISEDPQSQVDEHNDRAATSQKVTRSAKRFKMISNEETQSETDEGYDRCAKTTRTLRQGTLAKFRRALARTIGKSEPEYEDDGNDVLWSTTVSHHYPGPNSVVSISSDSADTTMDDAPEKSPPNSSIQLRPHPNHKDHIPANILDQQQIGQTVETQPTVLNEAASPQDDAFEDCSRNEDTYEPQSYTSNATPAITAIETPKKSVQTLKDGISSMHKSYMEEKLAIDKVAELLATAQESSGRLKRNCDAAQATADIHKMKLKPGLFMVPGMRREWHDAQSTADKLRRRLNVIRAELEDAISYIADQRAEQAIERASLSHYTLHAFGK
ncbi:MAG: hypothetical protein Q9205_007636, partial [Flavoplaca limonia]